VRNREELKMKRREKVERRVRIPMTGEERDNRERKMGEVEK